MPGDQSPQGLSDGCLWAQEYAALAKTLHAKIQKKIRVRCGADYGSEESQNTE